MSLFITRILTYAWVQFSAIRDAANENQKSNSDPMKMMFILLDCCVWKIGLKPSISLTHGLWYGFQRHRINRRHGITDTDDHYCNTDTVYRNCTIKLILRSKLLETMPSFLCEIGRKLYHQYSMPTWMLEFDRQSSEKQIRSMRWRYQLLIS